MDSTVNRGFERLRKLTLRLHVLDEQPTSPSHLGPKGLGEGAGEALRDLLMIVRIAHDPAVVPVSESLVLRLLRRDLMG